MSATNRADSAAPASAGETRRRRRTCDSSPCVADAIGDAGNTHVDVATVPADDETECHHPRGMYSAPPGETTTRTQPRRSAALPTSCGSYAGQDEPGPLGTGAPSPNGACNHTSLCPDTTRSTDDVSSKCVSDEEGAALMMIMTCRSPCRRRNAGGRSTTPAGNAEAPARDKYTAP